MQNIYYKKEEVTTVLKLQRSDLIEEERALWVWKRLESVSMGEGEEELSAAEWREESLGTALMDGIVNSTVCAELPLSQCVSVPFRNISEKLII